MPLSWDLPSHRLMRETLNNGGPGSRSLGSEYLRKSLARRWVEDPPPDYEWLAPLSESLDIWETEYLQVLQGNDAVLEWVKSTGLRPVLNSLERQRARAFSGGISLGGSELFIRRGRMERLYFRFAGCLSWP